MCSYLVYQTLNMIFSVVFRWIQDVSICNPGCRWPYEGEKYTAGKGLWSTLLIAVAVHTRGVIPASDHTRNGTQGVHTRVQTRNNDRRVWIYPGMRKWMESTKLRRKARRYQAVKLQQRSLGIWRSCCCPRSESATTAIAIFLSLKTTLVFTSKPLPPPTQSRFIPPGAHLALFSHSFGVWRI